MDNKQQKIPTMHGPSLTPFHHARRKPRELTLGGRGGGPHGRARWRAARGRRREVVGGGGPHGRARWRASRGEARALVSRRQADVQAKMNRRRREEEERKGGGVRRGRRGGDRSAPGIGGYIPGRFTPGASHQPGVKVLYSRCVLPTGSKGTPGW